MFLVRSCKSLGLFVWNMALLAFWVANILLIICGHAKGRVWPQIQQARLAPCQMPVVNSIINKTPKTNYFVVLSTVPKWKIPKKTVIYVQHITPYSKIISTQLWDMGWFSSFEFTSTTLSSLGSLGRKPDMGSTCRPGTQNLGMQLANDADLDARADDMRLHPGKEGLGCHGEALLQPFFSQKKKRSWETLRSNHLIPEPSCRVIAGFQLEGSSFGALLLLMLGLTSMLPMESMQNHGMDAQQLNRGLLW